MGSLRRIHVRRRYQAAEAQQKWLPEFGLCHSTKSWSSLQKNLSTARLHPAAIDGERYDGPSFMIAAWL
jgi:hypothetical protein